MAFCYHARMEIPNTSDYTAPLLQIGLDKNQSAVYEALIKNGLLPARAIAIKSGVSRQLTYKALDELVEMGLVEKKDEPKKVARFEPLHPLVLKTILEKRLDAAQSAKVALDGVLANLISRFNMVQGQPGVRVIEGTRGIEELYEDILNEAKPLLLLRSFLDDTRSELASLVAKQLRDQVRVGIHTRALTPPEAVPENEWRQWDQNNNVERKIIARELFEIPAQIIIYADKVAITAYEPNLITTIIENSAIQKTFSILFELIWSNLPLFVV